MQRVKRTRHRSDYVYEERTPEIVAARIGRDRIRPRLSSELRRRKGRFTKVLIEALQVRTLDEFMTKKFRASEYGMTYRSDLPGTSIVVDDTEDMIAQFASVIQMYRVYNFLDYILRERLTAQESDMLRRYLKDEPAPPRRDDDGGCRREPIGGPRYLR